MADASPNERQLRHQIEALRFQRERSQNEVVELYAQKQELTALVKDQSDQLQYLAAQVEELKAKGLDLQAQITDLVAIKAENAAPPVTPDDAKAAKK